MTDEEILKEQMADFELLAQEHSVGIVADTEYDDENHLTYVDVATALLFEGFLLQEKRVEELHEMLNYSNECVGALLTGKVQPYFDEIQKMYASKTQEYQKLKKLHPEIETTISE